MISRGYGSQSKTYPLLVTPETDPVQGGDEPVLIAKRTGCACVDFTESSTSYRITLENTGLRSGLFRMMDYNIISCNVILKLS